MTGRSPHAGRSIIEILWEELDSIMDRLVEDGEPEAWTHTVAGRKALEAVREWGEERGQAQGMAYAIAVLTNPYHVDVDAIRAEAVRRRRGRENE